MTFINNAVIASRRACDQAWRRGNLSVIYSLLSLSATLIIFARWLHPALFSPDIAPILLITAAALAALSISFHEKRL